MPHSCKKRNYRLYGPLSRRCSGQQSSRQPAAARDRCALVILCLSNINTPFRPSRSQTHAERNQLLAAFITCANRNINSTSIIAAAGGQWRVVYWDSRRQDMCPPPGGSGVVSSAQTDKAPPRQTLQRRFLGICAVSLLLGNSTRKGSSESNILISIWSQMFRSKIANAVHGKTGSRT